MQPHNTGLSSLREPSLSAIEAKHIQAVNEHITQKIAASGGWLSFEGFMEIALYAPGLGYYSAGAHKLGAGGDFNTAPELSPLFGGCVARQCAEVLSVLGGGSILEIGAGSGRLAGDILTRLESLGALPERYLILEVSADLRARQHQYLSQRLPHLAPRLQWLDTPLADSFEGVIVANEVLDALPVVRFRWHRAGVLELGVRMGECGAVGGAVGGEPFVWVARPAAPRVVEACGVLRAAACGADGGDWSEGYESEYCPRLSAWTREVTASLRRGAVFWFDYGLPRAQYYFGQRYAGTLICHFRQRAHADPFRYPGLQDITAWVDFTALAEAAPAEFEVAGFTTQAYFLAATHIDEEMRMLAGDDAAVFARLANQARQLMLPGEMGESFKAMAWTRGLAGRVDAPSGAALLGFKLQDLRHTL